MWAAITDRMARTFSRTIEVIETTIFITTGAPGETQIPTQALEVTGDIPLIAMGGSHFWDGPGITFWGRLSLQHHEKNHVDQNLFQVDSIWIAAALGGLWNESRKE